jgi:uncharacterized protein YsxB (DUF464 family)
MRVRVLLSADGALRRFEAHGHAGSAAGANIPCAAVTTLLRTAGRLCIEHGIAEGGGAEKPGEMALIVSSGAPGEQGWLRGMSDFLMRGLKDLQAEFPAEIALRVEWMEG